MNQELAKMTLKEKIGQLLIAGFVGYEYNDNIKTLIEEYKLGNVVLLTKNFQNIKQFHDLCLKLYTEIQKNSKILPFMAITQEGGMVTRIVREATFFPGNMTLGATKKEYVYEVGRLMAEELFALGINLNFAPSLDINNNPDNPVIGVRSYSDNPEVVARYGLDFIRGLQSTGMIATAKHFPGHGDTDVDSHFGLPRINHSRERIEKVELVPFKKAIDEVKAIMPAHIFFQAFEENQIPVTISKKVITGLLRQELGFKGLIISDAMEMKAIIDNFGIAKGAVLALAAGQDQLIVSSNYEYQVEILKAVEQAVLDGVIPLAVIDEKVARILNYKKQLQKIYEDKFVHKKYEEKREIILNKKSKEFVSKIVDESLTLVKGNNLNPQLSTLVLAPSPFATTVVEEDISNRSIVKALNREGFNGEAIKMSVNPNRVEIEELMDKAKNFDQVLVCTYNAAHYQGQIDLINRFSDETMNLFVLSTKSPYDIFKFKQIENYLCLYEYTPNSVMTIVKYLQGKLKPQGKLPIALTEKIKVGASIYVGLKEYPVAKNIEYLQMLKENGIDRVFISAHIPEMNNNFVVELVEVCNKAKELALKVILDVSRPMMEQFNIPEIYSLRLDYGFNNDEIVELCKQDKFIVELNASTITIKQLEYFKNCGVDLHKVRISHNFYPKLYTGISREEVIRRNKIFKQYGLNVMMYIPSQNQKRPPMYEGLPTIEEHRYYPLEAVLSEIRGLGIDEVFFGDCYASKEEIEMATTFDYDVVQIPIVVNKGLTEVEKELLQQEHHNRIDQPTSFIRSSCRLKTKEVKPKNTIIRKKGNVTIDNQLFARYQGEVCLMLTDLPQDDRVNVVGNIACDIDTLTFIKPGDKFRLIIKGEK